MTLWSDRIQVDACIDSLTMLDHLTETNPVCVNDFDSTECDPCTKHFDFFFDKYDVFVL